MSRNHPITDLSAEQLLALADIQKERVKLVAKLNVLNVRVQEILAQNDGSQMTPKPVPVGKHRGAKKEAILTHLMVAGKDGLSVLDLAQATGFDRQEIDRFVFSKALLREPGFRKIGPARYVYQPRVSGNATSRFRKKLR